MMMMIGAGAGAHCTAAAYYAANVVVSAEFFKEQQWRFKIH